MAYEQQTKLKETPCLLLVHESTFPSLCLNRQES